MFSVFGKQKQMPVHIQSRINLKIKKRFVPMRHSCIHIIQQRPVRNRLIIQHIHLIDSLFRTILLRMINLKIDQTTIAFRHILILEIVRSNLIATTQLYNFFRNKMHDSGLRSVSLPFSALAHTRREATSYRQKTKYLLFHIHHSSPQK